MDSTVEDPSYLGGSPRHHPLPTTSINHADLVSPIKQLDLSDSDDDDGADDAVGQPMVEVKISEASDIVACASNEGDLTTVSDLAASGLTTVESAMGELESDAGKGAIGVSATPTSSSSVASSATISEASIAGDSAVSSKTNAQTAKVKKIKPAGRVVASRYMAEV